MALITKDAIDEIIQLSRQTSVSREDIATLNNAIRSEASARKLADKVVAKTSTEITYTVDGNEKVYTVKWNFDYPRGMVIPWFLARITTASTVDSVWVKSEPYTIEEAKQGITFRKPIGFQLENVTAWVLLTN